MLVLNHNKTMSTARSSDHGAGDTLGADTLDQCQYLMEQRASELRDGGLQEAGIITARLLALLDEVVVVVIVDKSLFYFLCLFLSIYFMYFCSLFFSICDKL